ncbi:hypothetical protein Misp01_74420 [Microtetraspora sp. NBRC 13810]|nr:hypothetical protein Misp01_74420 [Microtetraspora sp. NBRC 13810]
MRGLTHRAVDEAAGLPGGSTSNLARTRAALLELTLARLTELESADFAQVIGGDLGLEGGVDGFAETVARLLHHQLTEGRRRTLARYELALEATRRPELREVYDRAGARFRTLATELFSAAGSADPARHGGQFVAFAEGMLFDAVAGAGARPSRADLRAGVGEILRGMLTR